MANNALSAKNIRIHGMSSAKWTTKDKLTQFKGLVNLYKRDRQISQVDAAVAKKRQHMELINLKKSIGDSRKVLNNAIHGDRQKIRNILSENRDMQLAYKNSDTNEIIENVDQNNFTQRKLLDKLSNQMKLKSKQLINLKLDEAVLQDRLKYEVFDKLAEEKEAQIITGKVQDALLKKEAALAIQQTYAQIIDVMKKDAIYFNGILLTIENDYWYQCRCVLHAAKQGQLATEYKHDRKLEYDTLEKAITNDMQKQKTDLQLMKERVESLQVNMKYLLRRDSDLTTCITKIPQTKEFVQLHADLDTIKSALNILKDTTLVSSFEQIYPSLQQQLHQMKRLTALARKCDKNRDRIFKKLNHAECMKNVLETTMVEGTSEYKKRKKDLLNAIEEESKKLRKLKFMRDHRVNLLAEVKISLIQIKALCDPIKTGTEKQSKLEIMDGDDAYESDTPMQPRKEDSDDASELIASLQSKLSYLMSNFSGQLDSSKINFAYRHYETLMNQWAVKTESEIIEEHFVEETFTTDTAHLLTREDIKKQSAEIVAANADTDEFALVPQSRRRKWK